MRGSTYTVEHAAATCFASKSCEIDTIAMRRHCNMSSPINPLKSFATSGDRVLYMNII
jgi:hypothetical protein